MPGFVSRIMPDFGVDAQQESFLLSSRVFLPRPSLSSKGDGPRGFPPPFASGRARCTRQQASLLDPPPYASPQTNLALLFFAATVSFLEHQGISNEADNTQKHVHLRPRRALTKDSETGQLVLNNFSMEAAEAQVGKNLALAVADVESAVVAAFACMLWGSR